jgi:hypothetical protein
MQVKTEAGDVLEVEEDDLEKMNLPAYDRVEVNFGEGHGQADHVKK